MRDHAPFRPEDLAELDDRLLGRAIAVVPMGAVAAGQTWEFVIGFRHDVDNAIEPAVAFARWEEQRGYRSTYFILHTAPYWHDKTLLRRSLELISGCGHEIAVHNNALAAGFLTGRDPAEILAEAIGELRSYGFDIRGTVAHGDTLCYDEHSQIRFVNDELFVDCPRPSLGDPDRTVGRLTIRPVPLAAFELDYDANWLPRGNYLSDSGGRWSAPFDQVADGFPYDGQLHMLVHPDWWAEAFMRETINA